MSNPNTRTSPPLAGQPFIVEDTVFNTHRQNCSYNLDDTDTSTHTMNNQQDQTTENLNSTTHNIDTDNIQTDNCTEDTANAQQQQQQTTDQTLARTTPRFTIARTTPNTDNSNINLQLIVVLIIDLVPLSNSPSPDSNHLLQVLTELMLMFMTTCPPRRKQINEMRKYLSQLEHPN
jgi:hypothetical protein